MTDITTWKATTTLKMIMHGEITGEMTVAGMAGVTMPMTRRTMRRKTK